jgi:hypothetical protein
MEQLNVEDPPLEGWNIGYIRVPLLSPSRRPELHHSIPPTPTRLCLTFIYLAN